MARYFLDLPELEAPLPWDPAAGPRPERADTRYFGRALAHMDGLLEDPELDVFLTWDVQRLPAYGPKVVAVVLGDEAARVPRYRDRVRAVFKCYGARPSARLRPRGWWDRPSPAELLEWLVDWSRWLPSGVRGVRSATPLAVIPLGTYNQLDLPVVPMEERGTDVFFAGSVDHDGASVLRRRTPKVRDRQEMLRAVRDLAARRPDLRTDIRLRASFRESSAASPEAYSRALMDARVCLAPRGTSLETFRVLEGLRYGCIVVVRRLPAHWFYEGAPLVRVGRWSHLAQALEPFDEPAVRARWHRDALAWWRLRCSEEAVGRFLADRLNALADGRGRPARAPAILGRDGH